MTAQRVALLGAFAFLALGVGPAHAAQGFYVKIEGAKQGTFKGSEVGREAGRIPCLQFKYQLTGPRDAASGQASGKRQHGQIMIVKEVNAASPQILRALQTNELLRRVDFEFIRVAADGKEAVYKTLRITNAFVVSVRTLGGGEAKGARPLEEVTLSFDQGSLESKGADAKPIPFEHWVSIEK